MTTYNADERWQEIYETASEDICPMDYKELINFTEAWDLPDKYSFVVRVFDRKKCKLKEKSFKDASSAWKYLNKRVNNDDLDIIFYDDEGLRSNCSFSDVS